MEKNLLVAYVETKDLGHMDEADVKALDVINIAFALVVDGKVTWEHPECEEALAKIRQINPELKIVISVGGWGAGGFSEAAYTGEGRALFARTAVELVGRYGLDGIDIDWEYPCLGMAKIGADAADKENFTLLLAELREQLEAVEKGRYLLTIAAGGDTYFVRNTQMEKVQQYLDYVQLMTYDLRGGFQILTGHHTNLYSIQADLFDPSMDKAVRVFHEAGVPYEKIVVGAAFYSREWVGVPDRNHGLCQHAEATAPGHSYAVLLDEYVDKNGYVRYWDDEAKAPYLFNGSRFISYEDEKSLSCKIAYLKEKGLKGIMFWVYGEDTTYTLVKHMRKELGGKEQHGL